jgi:hypothetical protein
MPQVSLPIIGELIHPSTGLLSFVLEGTHGPGGDGSLVPPQGPLALTYGLRTSIFSRPAGWGMKLGNPSVFNPPFLELAVTYTTIGGLRTVTKQIEWIAIDGTSYFWDEPLPGTLLYHIEPGWTLTFEWLQT